MAVDNSTSSLSAQSVEIIRSYLIPQMLFLIFGTLNAVCCFFSLTILQRLKQISGRVFVLFQVLFLNDALMSVYIICYQIYHLYNGINGIGEVQSRKTCFLSAGFRFLLSINGDLISMMLAIDRLKFAYLKPHQQILHNNHKFRFNFASVTMIFLPFVLSGSIYLVALFAKDDPTILILYCSGRDSSSFWVTMMLWGSIFCINLITMLLYTFMLLVARWKLSGQIEPEMAPNEQNTVVAINAKMYKKLGRNLAVMTILYFFVGLLPNGLTTIFASFMPSKVLTIGVYYGWLSYVGGVVYTVTFVMCEEYRQEAMKLFRYWLILLDKDSVHNSINGVLCKWSNCEFSCWL